MRKIIILIFICMCATAMFAQDTIQVNVYSGKTIVFTRDFNQVDSITFCRIPLSDDSARPSVQSRIGSHASIVGKAYYMVDVTSGAREYSNISFYFVDEINGYLYVGGSYVGFEYTVEGTNVKTTLNVNLIIVGEDVIIATDDYRSKYHYYNTFGTYVKLSQW